jgi:hypothetical protein
MAGYDCDAMRFQNAVSVARLDMRRIVVAGRVVVVFEEDNSIDRSLTSRLDLCFLWL